jgi:chromosome segregation ATPase
MTDIELESTSPDPGSAIAAEPEPVRAFRPRRTRANVGLGVALVVLLGLTAAIAFHGVGARSSASDDRARTRSLTHQESALESRQERAERAREATRAAVETVQTRLEELGNTLDGATAAEDAYTSLTNHAADLYNAGDEAGSVAVFRNEAQAAFDALVGKVDTTNASLESVRVAMQHLQEELR